MKKIIREQTGGTHHRHLTVQSQRKTRRLQRQDRKMHVASRSETRVEEGPEAAAVLAVSVETKKWLYRIASWPNLTQILFMSSISLGGTAWMSAVEAQYPAQPRLLFDYAFASALGYALSMFAETLRDRKLISLDADFACLLLGVVGPMLVVSLDAIASVDAAQINPILYWRMFGNF